MIKSLHTYYRYLHVGNSYISSLIGDDSVAGSTEMLRRVYYYLNGTTTCCNACKRMGKHKANRDMYGFIVPHRKSICMTILLLMEAFWSGALF